MLAHAARTKGRAAVAEFFRRSPRAARRGSAVLAAGSSWSSWSGWLRRACAERLQWLRLSSPEANQDEGAAQAAAAKSADYAEQAIGPAPGDAVFAEEVRGLREELWRVKVAEAGLRAELGERRALHRSVALDLQLNHRATLEKAFDDSTRIEIETAQKKHALVSRHRELGFGLTPDEFEELRGLWQSLLDSQAQAETDSASRSDIERSSSGWTPADLAQYVQVLQIVPWNQIADPLPPKSGCACWRTEELADFLRLGGAELDLGSAQGSDSCAAFPAPVDDQAWFEARVTGLETALAALGVPSPPPQNCEKAMPATARALDAVAAAGERRDLSEAEARELLSAEDTQKLRAALGRRLRDLPTGTTLQFPASLQTEDRHRLHVAAGGAGLKSRTWKGDSSGSGDNAEARLEIWSTTTREPKLMREEADAPAAVATQTATSSKPEHGLRLACLDALKGWEVVSRVVVDTLLLPLCAKMGVVVTTEETTHGEGREDSRSIRQQVFPRSRCDYVLRAARADGKKPAGRARRRGDGRVLGTVEVKRCLAIGWEKSLAQGTAQCALQLLAWRSACAVSQEGPEAADGPLLGVVCDGRRWLCLELHQGHLALTPVLDVVNEASLRLLLGFLAHRLRRALAH